MNHSTDVKKTSKIYSNYTIGLVSMIVAILLPIILPILGSFLAPFLFIAGIVAVFISKTAIWLKTGTVLLIVLLLIIFWEQYETTVLNYMPNPIENH